MYVTNLLAMPGWWFPAAVSRHAIDYDAQFTRTLIAAGIIFFLAQLSLVVLVFGFRAGRTAEPLSIAKTRDTHAELIWTTATAVLFLGLLLLGARLWASVQFTAAPRDAEPVEVLAKQFAWSFRYPGPDGRFGRTDVHLINDAAGNPFGLDPRDPAAEDDVTTGTLRIPAGLPVRLMLNSQDVIHSFFVRELRLKQDMVPGMRIPLSVKVDIPGTYEVPCAELCGLGHHQMRTTMIVMPPADYFRWKRDQQR